MEIHDHEARPRLRRSELVELARDTPSRSPTGLPHSWPPNVRRPQHRRHKTHADLDTGLRGNNGELSSFHSCPIRTTRIIGGSRNAPRHDRFEQALALGGRHQPRIQLVAAARQDARNHVCRGFFTQEPIDGPRRLALARPAESATRGERTQGAVSIWRRTWATGGSSRAPAPLSGHRPARGRLPGRTPSRSRPHDCDLLQKLGRFDEARIELERAAALTRNARERELLLERAAACSHTVEPAR